MKSNLSIYASDASVCWMLASIYWRRKNGKSYDFDKRSQRRLLSVLSDGNIPSQGKTMNMRPIGHEIVCDKENVGPVAAKFREDIKVRMEEKK